MSAAIAETLRTAAVALRKDARDAEFPDYLLALADWFLCQAETTCDCGVEESAVVVARLYLGEDV